MKLKKKVAKNNIKIGNTFFFHPESISNRFV